MGTHPIFESDFDCLTEMTSGSNSARPITVAGTSGSIVRPLMIGKTKSGRPWKSTNRKPIHSTITTKNISTSWKKKMELKQDKLSMKSRENEMKRTKNSEKEAERIPNRGKTKIGGGK